MLRLNQHCTLFTTSLEQMMGSLDGADNPPISAIFPNRSNFNDHNLGFMT